MDWLVEDAPRDELAHLKRNFGTLGFKEGLDAGEEAALQEGFNEGFRQGVAHGASVGELEGGVRTLLEVSAALGLKPEAIEALRELAERIERAADTSAARTAAVAASALPAVAADFQGRAAKSSESSHVAAMAEIAKAPAMANGHGLVQRSDEADVFHSTHHQATSSPSTRICFGEHEHEHESQSCSSDAAGPCTEHTCGSSGTGVCQASMSDQTSNRAHHDCDQTGACQCERYRTEHDRDEGVEVELEDALPALRREWRRLRAAVCDDAVVLS